MEDFSDALAYGREAYTLYRKQPALAPLHNLFDATLQRIDVAASEVAERADRMRARPCGALALSLHANLLPAARMRIPVIPATQSSAKLPRNPEEACHLIQTKAATPSERSDAWADRVTLRARRFLRRRAVCASNLL